MIHADHDDIAALAKPCSVVQRTRARAARVRAAVDVDHHGPSRAITQCGRPHIEEETVLARTLAARGLGRSRAVLKRIDSPALSRRRLRRHEASGARVRTVADALETEDTHVRRAAHADV